MRPENAQGGSCSSAFPSLAKLRRTDIDPRRRNAALRSCEPQPRPLRERPAIRRGKGEAPQRTGRKMSGGQRPQQRGEHEGGQRQTDQHGERIPGASDISLSSRFRTAAPGARNVISVVTHTLNVLPRRPMSNRVSVDYSPLAGCGPGFATSRVGLSGDAARSTRRALSRLTCNSATQTRAAVSTRPAVIWRPSWLHSSTSARNRSAIFKGSTLCPIVPPTLYFRTLPEGGNSPEDCRAKILPKADSFAACPAKREMMRALIAIGGDTRFCRACGLLKGAEEPPAVRP